MAQVNIEKIANTEARSFMKGIRSFGINEQGLLDQLATPEGRNELKSKFVGEGGVPYTDEIYDAIFKKLEHFARSRISSSESIIG